MERILWVVGCIAVWALLVFLMYRGWKGRARRQADRIGELPQVPADLGERLIAPSTGLYVGSTIAPSWQDRVAVGDLGFRATGEISRWTGGILLERDGASTLWIPEAAIRAIRTERGLDRKSDDEGRSPGDPVGAPHRHRDRYGIPWRRQDGVPAVGTRDRQ